MCMNKNGAITRTPCTKRGAPCCVGGMSSVISFFSIKLAVAVLLLFYSYILFFCSCFSFQCFGYADYVV